MVNRKALTLTELLVSTILIGIVMTGVASFSLFIKQAGDTTSAGTILAMQTITAMRYLKEDALSAVGDSSDLGVVSPNANAICFRHDVNDPVSYGDDTWECYWYESATEDLWKCPSRNNTIINNMGNCDAGPLDVIKLVTRDIAAAPYFSIVNDADGRFAYVDITLDTIANPAQPADPIKNPFYRLSTRVSPPAHGH